MSEYTEQAEKFLKTGGIVFTARLVGSDCPQFCTDKEKGIDLDKTDSYPRKTHIHGKHYLCFLHREGKTLASAISFDFWNSYADEEQNYACTGTRNMPSLCDNYRLADKYKGKKKVGGPSAYDLLECLTKSDPGTFEQFCSEYDYDSDSRKAESIYHAVQQEWTKIVRFFSPAELEQLQEIS